MPRFSPCCKGPLVCDYTSSPLPSSSSVVTYSGSPSKLSLGMANLLMFLNVDYL